MTDGNHSWHLLIHQLPARPAYLRVKVWRRLRNLGAVPLKGAIYALPGTTKSAEDFGQLLHEIEESGGQGLLCEAVFLDGLTDAQAQDLFKAARDIDYRALESELRKMSQQHKREKDRSADFALKLVKIRNRLAEIVTIDFFGANGRTATEALLSQLEHRHIIKPDDSEPVGAILPTSGGRTWVTRKGVHVDRIACAWLIRRFIDPKAKFRFVTGKRYRRMEGELRFDMPNGEFTHEGDKCSFEVLLERMHTRDMALHAIAQIIHNLDLNDHKFDRPEAVGIGHIVEGICLSRIDDMDRIARGSVMLDDIYERFCRRTENR